MAFVYKHIRKDNNQIFYIGIGKTKSRATEKKSRSEFWHNVVNKNGYSVEFIHENIPYEEAKIIEIELIKHYGRLDLGTGILVNLTDGGDGNNNLSQISIEKIRASLKGRKLPKELADKRRKALQLMRDEIGYSEKKSVLAIEMKKNGKFDRTGMTSPRKGVTLSDEIKKKVSIGLKDYYKNNVSKKAMPIDNKIYAKIYKDLINGLSQQKVMEKYGICKNRFRRQLALYIKENNLSLNLKYKKKNEQSNS